MIGRVKWQKFQFLEMILSSAVKVSHQIKNCLIPLESIKNLDDGIRIDSIKRSRQNVQTILAIPVKVPVMT